ncbi:MAG: DUF4911 domain-containing protein [Candidatus Saganbacteria bacterium]|nr:DUF4911 domain-containing protein [Candidatus Saganbacteria bacterium]
MIKDKPGNCRLKPTVSKDSQAVYIKLPRREVAFFCGFFEAYEGMTAIRTPVQLPGEDSLLKIMIAPDFKREVNGLLKFLGKTIPIKKVKNATVVETQ